MFLCVAWYSGAMKALILLGLILANFAQAEPSPPKPIIVTPIKVSMPPPIQYDDARAVTFLDKIPTGAQIAAADHAAVASDQNANNTSRRDRQIVQDIRERLAPNASLSSQLQNVQIHAENGIVTLQGKLASISEIQAVESAARDVAGSSSIVNQILVEKK